MKPSPMAGWTSGSEEGCGMGIIEGVIGPLGKLIDRVLPDPEARDRAKLELIRLAGSQEMEALKTQLSAIVAEAQSSESWTSRARASFLYVIRSVVRRVGKEFVIPFRPRCLPSHSK